MSVASIKKELRETKTDIIDLNDKIESHQIIRRKLIKKRDIAVEVEKELNTKLRIERVEE